MLRLRRLSAAVTAAGAAAVVVLGSVAAGPAVGAATGPVSVTPAAGTPELANTGSTQTIRQLAQCGGTVYAVGSFTTIKRYTTTYTRNNVFSFSATAPFTVTSWNPDVNGVVNSISFSSDCSQAYIGGKFTQVGTTTGVNNIAEISTSSGAVTATFKHSANGQVETVRRHQTHLLVGGYFKSINGSSADPYMASLDTTTGKDDGYLHLNISGNYQFCSSPTKCTSSNPTRVYNQQVSHNGTLDLVEGDFTSVGGQARRQIFMLNLGTASASVTAWTSPEWDGSDPASYPDFNCSLNESFYIRAASWSADDSTVYIATTGYHPYNEPVGPTPRTGLCDAVAAFPATQAPVTHNWIKYTGCDSYYTTAADASAVYVGGHERWFGNPDDCDAQGPGAVPDPGLAGITAGGSLLTGSSGAPRYTRSRGKGADDMLVTGAGLWIASDSGNLLGNGEFDYSDVCDGVSSHAGICFLPY